MRLHQALRGSAGLTFAAVGTTKSESNTIFTHADTQAGDLLILYDTAKNIGKYPTSVVPAGFTEMATGKMIYFPNYRRLTISCGIASAAGVYALNGMDSAGERKTLVTVRPSKAITSITHNVVVKTTSGTVSAYDSSADTPTGVVIVGMVSAVSPTQTISSGYDLFDTHGSTYDYHPFAVWLINGSADLGTHSITDSNNSYGTFQGYLKVA